jgi:hypothetical protein
VEARLRVFLLEQTLILNAGAASYKTRGARGVVKQQRDANGSIQLLATLEDQFALIPIQGQMITPSEKIQIIHGMKKIFGSWNEDSKT